ncbi:DUF2784 domain-containing protein [uncultured Cellulomonas sp.]|uniref:DUF2784 domain-containing protein n=1 Tax=uncultured Cellulomonas sp. TaxID=189682 RepID=UPI002611C9E6|nr:DUF2784 domain-containing protein [uncultured Cellulomonas sp.]
MAALLAADAVVVVHLAYLGYAAVGGFLALRNRAWLWPHLASTVWSFVVTLTAVGCPLTAVEKWLLAVAERPVYRGSFTAHYLRDVLYPAPWETAVWVSMMGLAITSYVLLAVRTVRARRVAGQPPGAAVGDDASRAIA